MTQPDLCPRCRWCRRLTNRRGSLFLFCEQSRRDAAFAKYPRQPCRVCPAFIEDPTTEDADADDPPPP